MYKSSFIICGLNPSFLRVTFLCLNVPVNSDSGNTLIKYGCAYFGKDCTFSNSSFKLISSLFF